MNEGGNRLVGWWGLSMLLQAVGVVFATAASMSGHAVEFLILAFSVMALADALKWTAAREFSGRASSSLWALAAPLAFLLIAYSTYLGSIDERFVVFSVVAAGCYFGAGLELAHANGKRLIPHWPAVVLLAINGLAYLTWAQLVTAMPIEVAGGVPANGWFPFINLAMVLPRVALAFIVLAMAKQRQEMVQRENALTDTLTGLPNRRALYESIDKLEQVAAFQTSPLSVLFFDLDHFKDVNNTYGHQTGDRMLKLFAATGEGQLNGRSMIARMGGEEFAAVLSGEDASAAVETAEVIRHAFAKSAAEFEGMKIGATVSVGVASRDCNACDSSDFGALVRQADAALYAAKRAGRDRVEFAEPKTLPPLPALAAKVRTAPRHRSRFVRSNSDAPGQGECLTHAARGALGEYSPCSST